MVEKDWIHWNNVADVTVFNRRIQEWCHQNGGVGDPSLVQQVSTIIQLFMNKKSRELYNPLRNISNRVELKNLQVTAKKRKEDSFILPASSYSLRCHSLASSQLVSYEEFSLRDWGNQLPWPFKALHEGPALVFPSWWNRNVQGWLGTRKKKQKLHVLAIQHKW